MSPVFRRTAATLFACLLAFGLAGCATSESAGAAAQAIEEDVLIVATAETFAEATVLTDFLQKKSVTYKHVEAGLFSRYEASPTVILLSGMDEAEGADLIAAAMQDADEIDWLKDSGNSAIYVRQDVWAESQKVMLVAGDTKWAAADALTYYRNQWLADLATWLEIRLTREEVYSY